MRLHVSIGWASLKALNDQLALWEAQGYELMPETIRPSEGVLPFWGLMGKYTDDPTPYYPLNQTANTGL